MNVVKLWGCHITNETMNLVHFILKRIQRYFKIRGENFNRKDCIVCAKYVIFENITDSSCNHEEKHMTFITCIMSFYSHIIKIFFILHYKNEEFELQEQIYMVHFILKYLYYR